MVKEKYRIYKRYKVKKDEMEPRAWETEFKKYGKMNRVLEKAGFKDANESWGDKNCEVVL